MSIWLVLQKELLCFHMEQAQGITVFGRWELSTFFL